MALDASRCLHTPTALANASPPPPATPPTTCRRPCRASPALESSHVSPALARPRSLRRPRVWLPGPTLLSMGVRPLPTHPCAVNPLHFPETDTALVPLAHDEALAHTRLAVPRSAARRTPRRFHAPHARAIAPLSEIPAALLTPASRRCLVCYCPAPYAPADSKTACTLLAARVVHAPCPRVLPRRPSPYDHGPVLARITATPPRASRSDHPAPAPSQSRPSRRPRSPSRLSAPPAPQVPQRERKSCVARPPPGPDLRAFTLTPPVRSPSPPMRPFADTPHALPPEQRPVPLLKAPRCPIVPIDALCSSAPLALPGRSPLARPAAAVYRRAACPPFALSPTPPSPALTHVRALQHRDPLPRCSRSRLQASTRPVRPRAAPLALVLLGFASPVLAALSFRHAHGPVLLPLPTPAPEHVAVGATTPLHCDDSRLPPLGKRAPAHPDIRRCSPPPRCKAQLRGPGLIQAATAQTFGRGQTSSIASASTLPSDAALSRAARISQPSRPPSSLPRLLTLVAVCSTPVLHASSALGPRTPCLHRRGLLRPPLRPLGSASVPRVQTRPRIRGSKGSCGSGAATAAPTSADTAIDLCPASHPAPRRCDRPHVVAVAATSLYLTFAVFHERSDARRSQPCPRAAPTRSHSVGRSQAPVVPEPTRRSRPTLRCLRQVSALRSSPLTPNTHGSLHYDSTSARRPAPSAARFQRRPCRRNAVRSRRCLAAHTLPPPPAVKTPPPSERARRAPRLRQLPRIWQSRCVPPALTSSDARANPNRP
ncbi:hypothetical protein B0H15DRAFT_1026412 [Mycena belliarum]|uniref:Uncharacterized protein n=1 Tax=Mycena belliarum TaxID=1033014 RepID=A0AAD6TTD7_9AGAR|nr:hypothetical protein B0H15DRAFT_1026412 [Mycena belliae]